MRKLHVALISIFAFTFLIATGIAAQQPASGDKAAEKPAEKAAGDPAAPAPVDGAATAPAEKPVLNPPVALVRKQAFYLTMMDGCRIAVDLWLPKDIKPESKVPTLIEATRYWRAYGTPEGAKEFTRPGHAGNAVNAQGFAYMAIDARGTGASFGHVDAPFSPKEIADYREVVDWIARQPWSNGKVGAFGISYMGTTAEFCAALNHPAVAAVCPRFSMFDNYAHLAAPGGCFNDWMVKNWGLLGTALDTNDLKAVCEARGLPYDFMTTVITGVKPVDADKDGSLLAAAVKEHSANLNLYEVVKAATFRDDWIGNTHLKVSQISPYGRRTDIEAGEVPMQVWASWMDGATAEGALCRFATFPNAQEVIIGPWNHGGTRDCDPFYPCENAKSLPVAKQMEMMAGFFKGFMMEPAAGGSGAASNSYTAPAAKPKKTIRYYVMGAKEWRVTETWPPEGVGGELWWFQESGKLQTVSSMKVPEMTSHLVAYRADPSSTTGENNRWHTEIGGSDVDYGDRAGADKKLLCHTSPPLTNDIEIIGTPMLNLNVSTTARDGALFAYLEAVSPDGKVVCLTEGSLRMLHRANDYRAERGAPPPAYATFGVRHSFLHADALPVTPDQEMTFWLSLLPVAARVPKGWCVRVALAAHDADTFVHYPPVPEPAPSDAAKPPEIQWKFTIPGCNVFIPSRELPAAQDSTHSPAGK